MNLTSKNTTQPNSISTIVILCLIVVFFCSRLNAQSGLINLSGFSNVLTLAPGDNNPRNSEGSFITLKNKRLLFIYSHYTGTSTSDHASAFLASRYSDDAGKTWSAIDKVEIEQEGKMNVMSVSLLRLQDGRIAMFYLRKNAIDDCIPMVRFSKDECKTWSDAISCISDKKGYFVLNNDRVIQLKNGRILMAVALHQIPGGAWSNTGKLFSYYSDDNGISWKPGSEVPNPENIVTQEPGVVELKNGQVFMFIRSGAGVQCRSFSADHGITWSSVERSSIASPLSPASIKRIPSTGDLFLVWNNNNGTDPVLKGKRTPLTIAISKDDGKTWDKIKNIEDDPDGWYCYIAIHFNKKKIWLAYCAGSQKQKTHLSKTTISSIRLDSVYK